MGLFSRDTFDDYAFELALFNNDPVGMMLIVAERANGTGLYGNGVISGELPELLQAH